MRTLQTLTVLTAFALLAGCQNMTRPESETSIASSEAVGEAADVAAMTGVTADSVKLVKTGALRLQVADADQSIRDLSTLTQSLGGMITHQNLEYQPINSREVVLSTDSLLLLTAIAPQATVIARIPAQNLEAFLFSATDKSLYPQSRSYDIDDQSLQYLQKVLQSRNRTEVLAQPSGNKGFTKADRVAMGDDAIDQNLAARRIDADTRYSTVRLKLSQHPIIRKERIANTNIAAYRTPAGQRFRMALNDGGRVFTDVFFGLVHLWAFILVGILVFFGIRYARRSGDKKGSLGTVETAA